MSSARLEIVRTDAGWHARFVAANGRIVWTTENYGRRSGALTAIQSVVDPFVGSWVDTHWWSEKLDRFVAAVVYRRDSWNKVNGLRLEIRDVDERTDRSRPEGSGNPGVTGAQPDEPASQAGRPVAGGAG